MNATGGIRRMPSSIALPASAGSARSAASSPGCRSRSSTAFASVDSTVSIAPKRITRSCATISSSESPRAGSLATALVTELPGRVRERSTSSSRIAFSSARASIGAALRLGIAVVDHGAGEGLVELLHARHVVEREPEHVAREPDRERRREAPRRARSRRAGRARSSRASMRRARAPRSARARGARGTARRTAAAAARARRRRCVSIITPSDARTRFGSAQTVKSSPPASSSRASACEVTSQPPSAGTHEIGSRARRRSSAPTRLSSSRSANSIAAPAGKRALRAAVLGLVDDDLRDERLHARPMLSVLRAARAMTAATAAGCVIWERWPAPGMIVIGRVQHARDAPSARDRHRAVARAEDDGRPAPARARGRSAAGPGCRRRSCARARPRCRRPRADGASAPARARRCAPDPARRPGG